MKIITLLLITISLYAGFFGNSEEEDQKVQHEKRQLHSKFRNTVNSANAIIKRGEYDKISSYNSNIATILRQIQTFDVGEEERKQLKNDMLTYSTLIKNLTNNLQNKAPNLHKLYEFSVSGLNDFNKNIISIGYAPLLSDWRELSSIKHKFVKKPSKALARKFNQKWTSVMVTMTELYLDDEMEEPLMAYLNSYKRYFNKLSSAYGSVRYFNINKIKPLSYKIKAQLELFIPYGS